MSPEAKRARDASGCTGEPAGGLGQRGAAEPARGGHAGDRAPKGHGERGGEPLGARVNPGCEDAGRVRSENMELRARLAHAIYCTTETQRLRSLFGGLKSSG